MTFENVFLVHNVYLEIAVATGVVGLFGYLGLIVSLNRVVFLKGAIHRLGYLPIALTVMSAFEPSLYDRAVWCPIALAFLAHQPRFGQQPVGSAVATQDVRAAVRGAAA